MTSCLTCQNCEYTHKVGSGLHTFEAKCLVGLSEPSSFQSEQLSDVEEMCAAIAQNCSGYEAKEAHLTDFHKHRANAIADLTRDLAIAVALAGNDFDVELVFYKAERMVDKMIAIGADFKTMIRKIAFSLMMGALLMTATSCASIQNSFSRNALNFTNKDAVVECFSGGKSVYKSATNGKVTDSAASDGFFFTDSNGKFVEINADCIVTYD